MVLGNGHVIELAVTLDEEFAQKPGVLADRKDLLRRIVSQVKIT
jgi:hypothetical protein